MRIINETEDDKTINFAQTLVNQNKALERSMAGLTSTMAVLVHLLAGGEYELRDEDVEKVCDVYGNHPKLLLERDDDRKTVTLKSVEQG